MGKETEYLFNELNTLRHQVNDLAKTSQNIYGKVDTIEKFLLANDNSFLASKSKPVKRAFLYGGLSSGFIALGLLLLEHFLNMLL